MYTYILIYVYLLDAYLWRLLLLIGMGLIVVRDYGNWNFDRNHNSTQKHLWVVTDTSQSSSVGMYLPSRLTMNSKSLLRIGLTTR